ncbi:MAG: helix-turn-helix domain-containing protein, partial [Candidatus Binatia bacterium]
LNNRELSLELAKELLINASDSGPAVGLEEIARGVSTHFGLSRQDLIARRRTKKVAEARQVAMYIMRQHTGASFPAIGDFLGGRDHSTVVHACQSVERKRKTDPQFRQLLDTVTRMIGCA